MLLREYKWWAWDMCVIDGVGELLRAAKAFKKILRLWSSLQC